MLVIHIPNRRLLLQHMALIYCIICGLGLNLVRKGEDIKQREGTEGGLTHAKVTHSSTLPLTHN